ncbi:hypothetical protein NLU13_8753 [Sarocladium strictum]|uniref:Fucose-specific lectin n=1 Tax=Sarocladium strictum TaxID=5046 RepID=A0AA39GC94_SARSR|nr:hypothetical protein NLU13_8753 [Sarocladium strictum]
MPFEDPYRVAAFLDADGHLATSIWTGTTMESFPLTSDTDSVLPKPAKSSPLHLIVLYQRDYVHILYVDEDHFLCLATMDARADRPSAKWSGGRLKTGKESTASGELETHQTTGDMRVTFETHNNAGDVVDGRPADRVNILYEEGSKKHREKDGYTLLSSIAPEIPSMWTVSRYQLSEEEKESMNPQEGSQGITFLPIFKDPEKEPGQQSGVRIIYDLSNEDHDSSFGVMKCKAKSETELDGCWFDMGHWETEKDHDKFLAMPKPLSLTHQTLPISDKSAVQDFVLLVLDGDNVFTELYWDGRQWKGMRRFLAVEDKSYNATRSFSSIAITADGHLFGISDGKLRRYQRLGNWWEGGFGEHDACWKLIEVVNTSFGDGDVKLKQA